MSEQTTPWWRRIFQPRDKRMEGARAAIDLLAEKFEMEAGNYERRGKDSRATFYGDMAAAIRNHRDWTLVRVSK